MIFLNTDGLNDVSPYNKAAMPIFLSNNHQVLEAPTLWAADVAIRRSNSDDTLLQYTGTLRRFLQWLDDHGYGAEHWQSVDEDIARQFMADLVKNRQNGKPSDETIEEYMARIENFYTWAREIGYSHRWTINREKVQFALRDQTRSNASVVVEAHDLKLANGAPTSVRKELEKFVDNKNLVIALNVLEKDDLVYRVIATVFRLTALRPKDLMQLPYKGTELNAALRPYREAELETLGDLNYTFRSKGKTRSIKVPAEVWTYVCKVWMPARQERAKRYAQSHGGVSPRNNVLFLNAEGVPVTRKMIRDHFAKVVGQPDYTRTKFTPYMLRHAFATYWVHDYLMAKHRLGLGYVYDAVADDALREYMGHTDIGITYEYYVNLVNRFVHDDLLYDLEKANRRELMALLSRAMNTLPSTPP